MMMMEMSGQSTSELFFAFGSRGGVSQRECIYAFWACYPAASVVVAVACRFPRHPQFFAFSPKTRHSRQTNKKSLRCNSRFQVLSTGKSNISRLTKKWESNHRYSVYGENTKRRRGGTMKC